jgi:hypothetical protein
MRKLSILLPAIGALALAACASEEASYEADATDESGGELIVTDEDPDAVPVDVPETEMTPVAEEGAEAPAEEAAE